MKTWVYVALALAALQLTGLSPFGAAYNLCGRTIGLVVPRSEQDFADDSIVSAMKNVTTDFNQLALVVGEFFSEADRVGPEAEAQFRFFLQEKARRSNAKLERLLDWLLAVYKIAFPVLVCLMLARGSGPGREEGSQAEEERIKALHGKRKLGHAKAQQELSPPLSPSLDSGSFYSASRSGSSKAHRNSGKLESNKRNRSGPDLSMRASGF